MKRLQLKHGDAEEFFKDVRFIQVLQLRIHVHQHNIRLLRITTNLLPYGKVLLNHRARRRRDDMRHVIIDLERILDAQLHHHFPDAVAALLLPVQHALLANRHDRVYIVELVPVVVEELDQQLAHRHRVLLCESIQQVKVARLVEVRVVGHALVGRHHHLWERRASDRHEPIPVGRQVLCMRRQEKTCLENWQYRRTDSTLEEVNQHEHEAVGAEGLENGVVEAVDFGPMDYTQWWGPPFFDDDAEDADTWVDEGVRLEKERVTNRKNVVEAKITLNVRNRIFEADHGNSRMES